MERKKVLFSLGLVVALALLWASGSGMAQPLRQTPGREAADLAAYDPSLYPQLPRQMNYQGVLRDEGGNLLNGSYEMTFTIYANLLSGGWPPTYSWTAVYSETQTVQVTDGLFNVVIGSQTPLDPGIFEGINLFNYGLQLGVQVEGEPELSPRVELLPVPYAFRAEYVNRFPAPHYDSGWYVIEAPPPDPTAIQFTHSLGGDTDNYVVDLECKFNSGDVSQCGYDNAHWQDLTTSDVNVVISNNPNLAGIRIRIWRTD